MTKYLTTHITYQRVKKKKSERDAKWNIYSKSQNIVVVIFITTGYIMLYIEIDSYTIGKSMCLPI